MIYKYRAYTKKGEEVTGEYEASTQTEVLGMLKDRGYMPVSVEADIEASSSITLFKKKVSKRDLAIFCRQFYTMLNSGISIVKTLDILGQQSENSTFKGVIFDVHEEVQKGISLSEAMSVHPKVFPDIMISMVEAGELSGNLDSIMDRLAITLEKDTKIENKVRSSMIYPIALGVICVAVVIFMLVAVLPVFAEMFEGSGQELPKPTQIVMGMSDNLKNNWYIYVAGIGAIVMAFNYYRSTPNGIVNIDSMKLKIPVIKDTTLKIITSRFTRTVSTLLMSGISVIQALEITSDVVGNAQVKMKLDMAIEEIKKGIPMSRALKGMDIFPPMVDSMILIGEESGALDEMLAKTSDFYDEEVEVAITKMTTLIEPVMLVFMAVIIGFIVLAMAMPMFEIAEL